MTRFSGLPGRIMNPKSYICTNRKCSEGMPHYASFGTPSSKQCYLCGKTLIVIVGEPRGTRHAR
jgi:hypothetical protein